MANKKDINENINESDKVFRKVVLSWFPGHMAKARREIKEKMSLTDVVINVVDARIPKSSFIPDIKNLTQNKETIIVMSKYDLCDKTETSKWKDYYNSLGYTVIYSDKTINAKEEIIKTINNILIKTNEKRKEKGLLPKKAKVMVMGVSNVGKSTLINKLVGKNIAKSANIPGVTKNISIIKINDKIDLIDTPGVLWPKIESDEVSLNLSSMSIIKESILPIDEVAIHILQKLNKYYKPLLVKYLGINDFDINNIEEYYKEISKYNNISIKNDEIDYDKINYMIINLIKNEKIKEITFDRI